MTSESLNPQASVTLDSVSDLWSYLTDDANVEQMYASLNERERLIGNLLNQSRSQRDLPPYSDIDLLIKIKDWKPVLREIPLWAMPESFTRAVAMHNPDSPFQAGEVAQAWDAFKGSSDCKRMYREHVAGILPPGPPCEWCGNTFMMRVKPDGQAVMWQSPEDTNALATCVCQKLASIGA